MTNSWISYLLVRAGFYSDLLGGAGDTPNSRMMAVYGDNDEDYTHRLLPEYDVCGIEVSDQADPGPSEDCRKYGADRTHALRSHETRHRNSPIRYLTTDTARHSPANPEDRERTSLQVQPREQASLATGLNRPTTTLQAR